MQSHTLMSMSLALVVGAALPSCKKAAPPEPAPEAVQSSLLVTAVTPSRVDPGEVVDVSVVGSGFLPGAGLTIGGLPAQEVAFVDARQLTARLGSLPVGLHDVVVTLPDGAQATLRGGFEVREPIDTERCGFVVLYFELDEAGLTARAEQLLRDLGPCYTAAPGTLQIDGHADERGTTDYNVSLSARRARTVERFLLNVGVSPDRMAMTAWGEERPARRGSGESVWALNRRVEITLNR